MRHSAFLKAVFGLMLVATLGSAGCKIQRSKLRSAGDGSALAKVTAPRTLMGEFAMTYEATPGAKRFPIHMRFVLDFSRGAGAAVLSTCVDSDGGLLKSNAKQRIEPDVEVALGLDAASLDAASGLKNSVLKCAGDVSFQDRVRGTGAGAGAGAGSGASSGLGLAEAQNRAQNLDPSVKQQVTQSGSQTGSLSSSGGTVGPDDAGAFTFTSKPDKNGKTIKIILRPNDIGWQVESVDYFGIRGFVERTETVAMQD